MAERNYERFLRMAMSRILGVPVEHVDDGSRNGMHDAEVRYPDGRIGAVEFTTVGKRSAMEMESFDSTFPVPSTPHWWTLRYDDNGVQWREIRLHVPILIEYLDGRGIWDADDLHEDLRGIPQWDWFERHNLSLRHHGPTSHGGRVDVLPNGKGGGVDSGYSHLNPWVERMQAEKWWDENVAKLKRSGRTELHLALRVHESEVPFPILSALIDGSPIPVGTPSGMGALTDLWIVVSYGTNLAHWSTSAGWTVHDYASAEEAAATAKLNSDLMQKMINAAERAQGSKVE